MPLTRKNCIINKVIIIFMCIKEKKEAKDAENIKGINERDTGQTFGKWNYILSKTI